MTQHMKDFSESQLEEAMSSELARMFRPCLTTLATALSESLDQIVLDAISQVDPRAPQSGRGKYVIEVELTEEELAILVVLPVSGGLTLREIVNRCIDAGDIPVDTPAAVADLRDKGLCMRVPDPCGGRYALTRAGREVASMVDPPSHAQADNVH